MNIYIPPIDLSKINKKALFILTRPFLNDLQWGNSPAVKEQFGVSETFVWVETIEEASVYFIPKPINKYSKTELQDIDSLCAAHHIKAYGYISGDLGEDFGHFEHIVFFRMGGFKSQLSSHNKGFPVSLSDHFEGIYKKTAIEVRPKRSLPVIGFCGHSDLSVVKRIKEKLSFIKQNGLRFLKKPLRKDYEPLFSSAFERARILKAFEHSARLETNFIYRKHYRAGAVTEVERQRTTLEYYDNLKDSDYVLCVRGAGNFSVRLYETLMMGRIPIFVNTDCLLPFENTIQWNHHVIWVEWKDRKNIANIVADFHYGIPEEDFMTMQLANRNLWKEQLSVKGILRSIEKGF